jgi:hypothetical protein
MDNIQNPSNSECYTPSEPFRIYMMFLSTHSKMRNEVIRRIQIFEVASSDSKHDVTDFESASERLCMLRVIQRFGSTTTVCSHAPIEE